MRFTRSAILGVVVIVSLEAWACSSSSPGRPESRPDPAAEQHLKRGGDLELKGDLDGAIAEYREAVRLRPRDAELHNYLAWVLGRKGDWNGAVAEYREVIRLQPEDAWTHHYLGQLLGNKGDWDGAIAQAREAIRLMPNDVSMHYFLGDALRQKGDRRAALDEYRRAVVLDQKRQARGPNDEPLLKQLSKPDPDDADTYLDIGTVLEKRGDLDGAIGGWNRNQSSSGR